jgi:subtilisin family serine protease
MNIQKRHLGWYFSCLMICFGTMPVLPRAQALEPASPKAGEPVRDANGRLAYMIELKAGAASRYSMERRDSGRFASYQRGNVVNLIEDLEWTHHISAISMTSLNSTTFTAYLDEDQLQELKADSRVEDIIPDVYMTFSDSLDTTAVWDDSATTSLAPPSGIWNGRLTSLATEIRGWGQAAVTNASAASNGRALVYVVDTGVGQHEDLNVIEWVNAVNPTGALCGTRTGIAGLPSCTTAIMPKVVGCYSHSTGVAGIIGAKLNAVGIKGVLPSAKIVSVSVLDPAAGGASCLSQTNPTATNVKAALEWVFNDIATNVHNGIPAVVNLSSNFTSAADRNLINPEIASLGAGTPGALVVQSAGNQFQDACNYAYSPQNSNDGVVVAGAINNHGQPVVPLNGMVGFWREWSQFGHESGSNYGSCVEAWAPGDVILMPVGDINTANNANTLYHSYAYGGGTSFAAPHVAGLAAYLIDTTAVTTAKQVELGINSHLASLGSVDPSARAIKLPTVVTLPTPHNTPYAELAVAAPTCRYPPGATHLGSCTLVSMDPPLPPAPTNPYRNRTTAHLGSPPDAWVMLDSWGSGSWSCDVKLGTALGGSITLGTTTNGKFYTTNPITNGANQIVYSSTCPGAAVTIAN